MAKKSNGLGRLLAAAAVVGAAAAGTYYYLKNRENSTDSEKTGGGEDFDEFDIFDDEDLNDDYSTVFPLLLLMNTMKHRLTQKDRICNILPTNRETAVLMYPLI